MRRHRRRSSNGESGSIGGDSWTAYSDLISGLLLIFIFVTVLKDAQLESQIGQASKDLRDWWSALRNLCEDAQLKEHGLAPDCDTGVIKLPEGVFFEFNKATLSEEGKNHLRAAVPLILAKLRGREEIWQRVRVEVRGHTDPRAPGPDPYQINLPKSDARAVSVLQFLTTDGSIEDRDRNDLRSIAIASGAADSDPPDDCDITDESCHGKMRRAEVHLRLDDIDIQKDLIHLLEQIVGDDSRPKS